MPVPVSETTTLTRCAIVRGDLQRAAAGHRILGIEEQVEEHLLQLAGVAVDERQTR